MIPNLAGYPKPTEMDMDKVRSTIKLFVRDWAEEGKHERDSTYQPMVEELLKAFSHIPEEQRSSLNVLVPGSGLGRLAFEVVKSGFSCQGNEFAFFMLLASNFILNRTTQTKQYIIYPFIHIFSNILSPAQHQLVPIQIPDVLPSSIPPTSNFSMVAGDFVEVYKDEDSFESFDAILTCFFIDTAKNIVEYLEVIRHVLKPNGVWINLGPLLYHWEGTSEMSIELSWEELKELISKMGFELKMEKTVSTTYSGNPNSMLKYIYDCIFFTALKK
ncbi:N2227-like protein [Paraphysoderma sedebokerense]|nr:N2227-like protein [Paraphysoderma sedebokerense]